MKTKKTILAWHFTNGTLRDGEPLPPIGQWLEHTGPVIPCKSGLHASLHPFDALQYAPGPWLHRVRLEGDLTPHGDPVDKYAGRRRKIIATINAEKLLRDFARWNARQVLHLWDAPKVVKDYLRTGDEKIRDAAWAAAKEVSLSVLAYPPPDASWSAAWAAMALPCSAARATVRYASSAAARDATAKAAFLYRALDAAKDDYIQKARAQFQKMVNAAFKSQRRRERP